LYLAVATRGFRRYSTYRAATLAGIFTNTVFGVIIAYTFIALWGQRPHLGGYSEQQALTFVWVAQALIMPVGLFGGGIQEDFVERVRSGAVAVDLHRPVPLLWWRFAEDAGRAAYHFLTRGLAPVLFGSLLFDLAWPAQLSTYAWFLVAVALAVSVGFAIRYLLGLLAFWVIDVRGFIVLLTVTQIFFSGMVLPLVVFPGWLRALAEALPFRCLVQVPADVFLHEGTGSSVLPLLAVQALWIVILFTAGQLLTAAAVRKVVVQGG
jgi:ABC-2 type transport system permease protein